MAVSWLLLRPFALVLATAAVQGTPSAQARPTEPLAGGQTLEREIARGERHSFEVALSAGEFLALVVTGYGATPELRLWPAAPGGGAPEAALLTRAHSGYPPMPLVWLAERDGKAAFEVYCPGGTRGRYTLRVDVRAPQPADLTRLRAQTARQEARRLSRAGGASLPRAIESYRAAIAAAEEVGDLWLQAQATNFLAWAHYSSGDRTAATAALDGLLVTVRGRGVVEADAVYYRAMLHLKEGETRQAMVLFAQALSLARRFGARPLQGAILGSMGQIYSNVGDERTSLGYYQEALEVTEAEGDLYDEAWLAEKVGDSLVKLGRLQEAERSLVRTLDVWKREIGDTEGEVRALTSLARLHRRLNDPARALDLAQRAAAIEKVATDIATLALVEVALAQEALGRTSEALGTAMKAQALLQGLPAVSVQWRVPALIARLERDRGRLEEAQRWGETAASAAEKGRASLPSERLRNAYSDLTNEVYDLQVDVLMRRHAATPGQGFDRAALEASERGRARSLRELLHEARVTLVPGLDTALVEEEARLREKLSAAAEAQRQRAPERAGTGAETELRALSTEYDAVRGRIRAAHPEYAALTEMSPIAAADLQKLVEPGTVLLEYDLGRPHSALWVVTSAGITSHRLPGEDVIGPLARRLHEGLSARNRVRPGTSAESRRRVEVRADEELAQVAARLGQILLGPVEGLGGHQRVVVVPDGVLHYVPFAVLPGPGPAPAEPLIARHEVLHLPSAAVLAALRAREPRARASRPAAVFADPVFHAADPRVRRRVQTAEAERMEAPPLHAFPAELTMDGGRLPRLAYTRTLAEEITKGVAAPLVALDFAASREAVTRGGLDQYRMVLFATHGILNSEYPELSGIALSMVDEQGAARDGFLRLQDIYHLRLNAELVVLGACETGLGRELRGEGLVGLARGFFYAGTSRVLASLWKVDEQATVELIKEMYRAVQQDGLSHPAALRQAQLRLQQRPRFRSPYYWAGFVLQGDWR